VILIVKNVDPIEGKKGKERKQPGKNRHRKGRAVRGKGREKKGRKRDYVRSRDLLREDTRFPIFKERKRKVERKKKEEKIASTLEGKNQIALMIKSSMLSFRREKKRRSRSLFHART